MVQKDQVTVEASFLKILDPVLMCSNVVNTATGISIDMNLIDKIVVSYVNNRAEFFEGNNMKMFESQDTIAESMGVDRKTVLRSLKKLVDVGLVCREIKYHVNKENPRAKPMPRTTYSCVKLIDNRNFTWKSKSIHRVFDQKEGKMLDEAHTQEYSIIPLKRSEPVVESKPLPKQEPVKKQIKDDDEDGCPF